MKKIAAVAVVPIALVVAFAAFAAFAVSCGLASQGNGGQRAVSEVVVPAKAFRADFFRAANAQWFAENPRMPAGYAYWNHFTEISSNNRREQIAMLAELASRPQKEGTPERRLADLFASVVNMKERNARGYEPIGPYVAGYRNARSVRELVEADAACLERTGVSVLLGFAINPSDDGLPGLTHWGPLPMPGVGYRPGNHSDPYIVYLTKLFVLSGNSPATAESKARRVYALESNIAAAGRSAAEAQKNPDGVTYPFYLFRTLYGDVDFAGLFARMGFRTPEYVIVKDQGMLEKGASFFTERRREDLALYAEARLLHCFAPWLSEDFFRAQSAFAARQNGSRDIVQNPDWLRESALDAACLWLPNDLGKAFVARKFSPEAKRDVEGLIARLVAEYRKEISACEWMGERTKAYAIEKLDKLTVKVGYPEAWGSAEEGVTLGQDLFKNVIALNQGLLEAGRKMLLTKGDPRAWRMPAFTVNAFCYPGRNEIVFPAGFLQPPNYDPEDSESRKLGMLGCVIGHEISHTFDAYGANFDANGDRRYWWTQKDRAEYDARCEKVRAFFDGQPIEFAFGFPLPFGLRNDGALTLNENMADINGVRCALEVLKGLDNPDYRAFFQAYAEYYRQIESRRYRALLASGDPHSLSVVRVNRTLSAFAEFHETYGIVEGDPLYVAPEDRVAVW